jgi:hypothetical protein
MGSIVSMIQDLRVKVIHILGSCTSLCQLLEVGINKPFKAHVQAKWEEFMNQQLDDSTEICALHSADVLEW